MPSAAISTSRIIAAAGLVAVVAAGAVVLRTDTIVSRGFDKALEASGPALSLDTAARKPHTQAAGDEGFWLTRAEVESPAPFAKPVSLGDRITITGRGGLERHLEVVDLKVIGDGPTRAGAAQSRLLLVTCRVAGDKSERGEAQVRFIIEAEPEPALPAPAKAL